MTSLAARPSRRRRQGCHGQVTVSGRACGGRDRSGLSSRGIDARRLRDHRCGRPLPSSPSLRQGVYRIEFSLPGYQKVTRMGIVVLERRRGIVECRARPRGRECLCGAAAVESGPLRPVRWPCGSRRASVHCPGDRHRPRAGDGRELSEVRRRRLLRRRPVPSRDAAGQLHSRAAESSDDGNHPGRHQSGTRSDALPAIPLERTSVTGLKHVRGVVSMARGTPRTPRRRTSSSCSTISRRWISAASGSMTGRAARRSAAWFPGWTSCAGFSSSP